MKYDRRPKRDERNQNTSHRDAKRHAARPRDTERPLTANVIYGVAPVIEALRAEKRRIDRVLIAEGSQERRTAEVIELCRSAGIMFSRVPRDSFQKYVDAAANTQGVIAFAAAAGYVDTDKILAAAADPALLLLLDGVEDPRNLGAILRVAECAAWDSAPPELAQAELSERLVGEWTPGLGLTPMCHDPSAGVREAAFALAVFRERGGQL